MSDGFFDMPAGYTDADLEMAELEARGALHAKRVRRFGEDNYRRLQAGETISHPCTVKDTGERYTVLVKMDEDEYPYYSLTGERWFPSSREARLGRSNYGGAGIVL